MSKFKEFLNEGDAYGGKIAPARNADVFQVLKDIFGNETEVTINKQDLRGYLNDIWSDGYAFARKEFE